MKNLTDLNEGSGRCSQVTTLWSTWRNFAEYNIFARNFLNFALVGLEAHSVCVAPLKKWLKVFHFRITILNEIHLPDLAKSGDKFFAQRKTYKFFRRKNLHSIANRDSDSRKQRISKKFAPKNRAFSAIFARISRSEIRPRSGSHETVQFPDPKNSKARIGLAIRKSKRFSVNFRL